MIPLRELGALLDRAVDVWAAVNDAPRRRTRT
jgi:hypothetical protein